MTPILVLAQIASDTTDSGIVIPDRVTITDANDALALITGKIDGWIEGAIATLPNLVVAVVLATIFYLISRVVRNVLGRGLRRTGISQALRDLVTALAGFAIIAAGLFVALGILGLDKTVTSLLAGVGILGLALGFAFQDLAANFMAGILLSVRRPFQVGHLISTSDFMGPVLHINLRDTVLRTFQGQIVRIPNKEVFNNPIVNYSEPGERRVDLEVGVSYGDDLERVKQVTIAAIEKHVVFDTGRGVDLVYTGFGESSIDFVVRFWLEMTRQPDFLTARSDAIMAIKAAYDEADITIPFPIRTLDFGIKGGATLTEAAEPLVRNGTGERHRERSEPGATR